ncbi:MAG: hypothetical protein M4D80_23865 [Myxococcota bacterium]|nr:hypothetical protein [Myxococcota bacterium]
MRIALLAVVLVTLSSTAHAGKGAILIPPLEVDVGVGVPVGSSSMSREILAGVHWASLAWKPTSFDVGIGYVGSFRRAEDQPPSETLARLRMHGGYFSLSRRLVGDKHWRTWLTARGELLRATDGERDFSAIGGALRVSTELFGSGAVSDKNAIAIGTIAVGIYFEATVRDVPIEYGRVGITSGVLCRLPFFAAGG